LNQVDTDKIVEAIKLAEAGTSAEIRIHVSKQKTKDPVKDAALQFIKLGMAKTEARNGVLIFVAPTSQNYAVYADEGIFKICPQKEWDEMAQALGAEFREKHFTEGLVAAIRLAGVMLKSHFPFQHGDKNELDDSISHD
ncbi:MAG: TPM domain-containing protein, partial [Verrucomicrobiota bacterium]|nr:TPM domain-containing protein [Verrucomicrobiota bacterium]